MNIPRTLLREGGAALVGAHGLLVYLAIHDVIWRSETYGSEDLLAAVARGEIVASLSVDKIAKRTGLSPASVRRSLSLLLRAGWIRRTSRRRGGLASLFVLGTATDGLFLESAIKVAPPGSRRADVLRVSRSARSETLSKSPGDVLTESSRSAQTGPARCAPGEIHKDQDQEERIKTHNKEHSTPDSGASSLSPPPRIYRRVKALPPAAIQPPIDPPSDAPLPAAPTRTWANFEPPSSARVVRGPQPDPLNPDRMIAAEELRALASVRVKQADGRRGQYTGEEAVAAWKSFYFRAFGCEDLDLALPNQRRFHARLFERRVAEWTDGKPDVLWTYVRDSLRLWEERPEGATFPSGVPALSSLLKQDTFGVSSFFKRWSARHVGLRAVRATRGADSGTRKD